MSRVTKAMGPRRRVVGFAPGLRVAVLYDGQLARRTVFNSVLFLSCGHKRRGPNTGHEPRWARCAGCAS